jgi:type 1 glutamine amidotransferase
MTKLFALIPLVAFGSWLIAHAADEPAANGALDPLKVLLIAGGCCHDYAGQKDLLKAGIESRLNARVDIEYTPDKSTKAVFPRYLEADWAAGYDVILHDECSADVKNKDYVDRILAAHKYGVPAVNLHCAMHSYRWGDFRKAVKPGGDNAGWYEMIGIQSTGHGPHLPINVTALDKEHPITMGMKDWSIDKDELYNNVQVFDTAHPLLSGKQMVPPRKKRGQPADPNAKAKEVSAVVAWTNEYGPRKTKTFSVTLGHYSEIVSDDRYMTLVTRGLLWVTGNLAGDGSAKAGYGQE